MSGPASTSDAILDRPVILIAEDEVLVRMLIADLLQDQGSKVIEAADAIEALRMLEARPDIHVVVTDVEMPPGPNGIELARRKSVRGDPSSRFSSPRGGWSPPHYLTGRCSYRSPGRLRASPGSSRRQ